jgi:hypothetical protein
LIGQISVDLDCAIHAEIYDIHGYLHLSLLDTPIDHCSNPTPLLEKKNIIFWRFNSKLLLQKFPVKATAFGGSWPLNPHISPSFVGSIILNHNLEFVRTCIFTLQPKGWWGNSGSTSQTHQASCSVSYQKYYSSLTQLNSVFSGIRPDINGYHMDQIPCVNT